MRGTHLRPAYLPDTVRAETVSSQQSAPEAGPGRSILHDESQVETELDSNESPSIRLSATNIIFNVYQSDMHTCLKIRPRETFSRLAPQEKGFGLDTELTAVLLRLGFRPFQVPVCCDSRSHVQGKKINRRDAVACLRILLRARASRKYRLLSHPPDQCSVGHTSVRCVAEDDLRSGRDCQLSKTISA